MDSWKTLGTGVDLGKISGLANGVDDVLATLAAVLKIIAAALDLIASVLVESPNFVGAVVEAAINVVEQAILDLLQNNVSAAVHLNLNWNPDWKYRRSADDSRSTPDFVNDNALPWVGTGMPGWLLDLACSAYDPTDPFRPLSDANTKVQGVIFVKGVPVDGDLSDLKVLLEVFSDFKELEGALSMRESLEQVTAPYEALLRLGPAAADAIAREVAKGPEELVQDAFGTYVKGGMNATNEPNSPFIVDEVTSFLSEVQPGDNIQLANSSTIYEIVEVVSYNTLRVFPPVARNNTVTPQAWEVRRGGVSSVIAALPQDLREFVPTPGAFPKWISVPTASLLPGVTGMFTGLHRLVELMRVGKTHKAVMQDLGLLLREKGQLLEQIVEELGELLDVVEGLTNFFLESHVIVVNVERGGVSGFVNAALTAENLPDFGSRGVVIGATVLATSKDPANHFENFFSLLGLNLSAYTDITTERTQGLTGTWNDFF